MRILLTAVNAKYIHSSLAIRSLKKYAEPLGANIVLAEYTINHQSETVLSDIYKIMPDVVCFSCYIWNISMILSLTKNLKKIMPNIKILLGGPEVSYDAEAVLKNNPEIDLVMKGEGEATFFDVVNALINGENIAGIAGTVARNGEKIVTASLRTPINLDSIPFVYDNLEGFANRICYYETQRGCPYSCQYCLSSLEKGVRFLSLERVKKDLRFFIDANVRQVKFVDRTFNANKAHAFGIWEYLIKNDNGHTNFHMEITADILDDEAIALLKTARQGLFQLEIGVQTTNGYTMEAIKRKVDFDKLSSVVKKIKSAGNIHQHLDLIAGLPFEDYTSFKKSFNDVYALEPEQFQLGFLKLLKGAGLRRDAQKYGIVYRDEPTYEVLATADLPYSDVIRLKRVEGLTELYYNSGKTPKTLECAIGHFKSPFEFYEDFGQYWEDNGHFNILHNKMELYTIFFEFANQSPTLKPIISEITDTLKFDLFLNDNIKTLPYWLTEQPWEKDCRRKYYNTLPIEGRTAKELSKLYQLIFFSDSAVLFDYSNRDSFFGHAHYTEVKGLRSKD